MPIPDETKEKLDADQREIVRVMNEQTMEKPWSRFMIERHMENPPTKATTIKKLDELVELEVIKAHSYQKNNDFKVYELAHDPVVTDGGRLRKADARDLVLLRNKPALDNVVWSGAYIAAALVIISAVDAEERLISGAEESFITMHVSNIYQEAALLIGLFLIVLILLLGIREGIDTYVKPRIDSVRR